MWIAVLLDDGLVPWVIEANTSPSLSSSGALDFRIKSQLIMDMLNIVGFVPVNRDEYKRTERVAKTPEGFGSGAGGRPGSAYRGRSGERALSLQQRNARRRIVTAAATIRGHSGAVSRENADQIVAQLTDEEREVLRMVEDEFERANTCTVSLKLAYPKAETAALYAPLWDTPRYYMTVLLSWLQSSTRAKFGHHALADDFTGPEPTGRKSRTSTGGKGVKAAGSKSVTGRLSKSGSAKMAPTLERIAGDATPPIEMADMRWLARQRAGSGKPAPVVSATAPRRAAKTKAPARRSATAPRADAGKTKLVLRSSVPAGSSSLDKARTKRSASVNGVARVQRAAKGDSSRYGYDSSPIAGLAHRGGSTASGNDANVLQRSNLGALRGVVGTANSASGAL